MPFEKGQSGNPGGKPLGPRNTLKVRFINTLLEDFDKHGAEVLAKLRLENPVQYVNAVIAVLPKDVNIKQEVDVTHHAESVSATARRVAEILGSGASGQLPESLPH
jgi:hypothetical protein